MRTRKSTKQKQTNTRKHKPGSELTPWQKAKVIIDGLGILIRLAGLCEFVHRVG